MGLPSMVLHHPHKAGEVEVGSAADSIQIITIQSPMVHFHIMVAHLTIPKHLVGPHLYKDMILASFPHLQEEHGLRLLFSLRVMSDNSRAEFPQCLAVLAPHPFSQSLVNGRQPAPIFLPPRNFSGRRSFMSKPVYPLVSRNPVSDGEIYGIAGPSIGTSTTPGSTFSPNLKLQKAFTHLQRMEASANPNTSSSRREGFRWSNASSYDFGFGGDTIDITEHIGFEIPRSPYTNSSARHQKCALCDRPLWQKSPSSTHHIVRNTDMPVAGVLPCRHVFHAECLEETTPKSQIHEPPCPVCQKTVCSDGPVSFSESLQVA